MSRPYLEIVRSVLLASWSVIASCSFFTPSNAWHPTPQLSNEPECPPYLLPVLDTLVASVGAYVIYRTATYDAQSGPNAITIGDTGTAMMGEMLLFMPWIAGSVYGWTRMHRCESELPRDGSAHRAVQRSRC